MALHSQPGRPRATRLAGDLAQVRALAAGRAVPLGSVMDALGERGFALAVLLLVFPFVLPVPMMGLATPVGFALALCAGVFACGRRPRLPAVLGRIHLAPRTLETLARRVEFSARLLRPRLAFMVSPRMSAVAGLSLACAAVALALPIPLPASNFFPAAAMILLAAGLLEGDGLLVLAGHAATAAVCTAAWLLSGLALSFAQRALVWVG